MTDEASTNPPKSAQPPLVIATRASPLAMAQAYETRDRLVSQAGYALDDLVIEPIVSRGDKILDKPLMAIGGKGLFTEEIEQGLLDGRYDLAVHSLKDLPTKLPEGLIVAAYPEREDPRDVLISNGGGDVLSLPQGARVGTASIRRAAQLRRIRPDLNIVSVRGNVQTRLAKLGAGEVDALMLAAAGLQRLNLDVPGVCPIPMDQMLPAPGQACLAIECSASNAPLIETLSALSCAKATAAVTAERAFLDAIDGDCRTPVAAHAHFMPSGALHLQAQVLHPVGTQVFTAEGESTADDPLALGARLADDLRVQAGDDFLAEIKALTKVS
ncbi:MAG: hydroxymethylbilane synthase [Pseudomonadota bacterium]